MSAPFDYGRLVQEAATRAEVAKTYALMLRCDTTASEWTAINEAILLRWRPSGLTWIKRRARWLAARPGR